jgi:hypothetical protein
MIVRNQAIYMRSLPTESHRSDERAEGEHNSNGVACEMRSETEEGRSAIATFNCGPTAGGAAGCRYRLTADGSRSIAVCRSGTTLSWRTGVRRFPPVQKSIVTARRFIDNATTPLTTSNRTTTGTLV